MSGLIGPPAYANFKKPYYLTKSDNLTNDLVSPVNILSADLSKSAGVVVDNANGSIAISPAGNPLTSSPARYGLNLESGVNGIIATVGDPTLVAEPILQLASSVSGAPNFGRVYDTYYNRPFTIGPEITGDFITNSPASGTLLSTFDTNTFVLDDVGFYRLQLDIFLPANQQVNFPSNSAYSILLTTPTESSSFGGLTFTGTQIFSNYNAMFPADTPIWFNFNTLIYLAAGTYKLAGYQAQGTPFIFGPNMDSDTYPDNFKFSIYKYN